MHRLALSGQVRLPSVQSASQYVPMMPPPAYDPHMFLNMTRSANLITQSPASNWINLTKYPLDDLRSPLRQKLITDCKEQLADDGCCIVPGFLTQAALTKAVEEIESRQLTDVYYLQGKNNIYFSNANDPSLPEDHPARIEHYRSQGFIAGDSFHDSASVLKQLFFFHPLKEFVSEILGITPLYYSEDPLSGVMVSVQTPEQQFPWHFDGADFTVTILLQKPQHGGLFQYVPNLRTESDERLEEVRNVLHGRDTSRLKTLELGSGDLQIFRGKHSLHRVTSVEGTVNRYLATLMYTNVPGYVNTVERSRLNTGRVLACHYERDQVVAQGKLGS